MSKQELTENQQRLIEVLDEARKQIESGAADGLMLLTAKQNDVVTIAGGGLSLTGRMAASVVFSHAAMRELEANCFDDNQSGATH